MMMADILHPQMSALVVETASQDDQVVHEIDLGVEWRFVAFPSLEHEKSEEECMSGTHVVPSSAAS